MVWMVYPVLLVLLDCVYLDLLGLKESRDRWVSLDSQVMSLQAGDCRVFVPVTESYSHSHLTLAKKLELSFKAMNQSPHFLSREFLIW